MSNPSGLCENSGVNHPDPSPYTPPTSPIHAKLDTTSNAKSTPEHIDPPEATDDSSKYLDSKGAGLIPVPPPYPKGGVSILAHKLWIGNLDKRLTEQNILGFVTQYGRVVSFRFLFKSHSERTEPRGYVFVEYSNREEAEAAKAGLDGKKALGRKIIVDWAKANLGPTKKNANTVSETWDANAVSKTIDGRASTSSKIAALEAKLRQMEESVCIPPAKRPHLSPTPLTHKHTLVTGGAVD